MGSCKGKGVAAFFVLSIAVAFSFAPPVAADGNDAQEPSGLDLSLQLDNKPVWLV
jgi:hypothetical protein